jgi:hypothetical protein
VLEHGELRGSSEKEKKPMQKAEVMHEKSEKKTY